MRVFVKWIDKFSIPNYFNPQMLQLSNFANLYKKYTYSGHLDMPYIAQFPVITVFASLPKTLVFILYFYS